ncbi:MAG: hypothetical protein WAM90_13675 [Rhodanobacter sp.]
MTIEIKHAVRKSLSRAVFCLLMLLPIGAVMASSKPTVQSNPFMQNPSQTGQMGAYTTQPGVVSQGVPAAGGTTGTSTSTTVKGNKNSVPPRGVASGGALPAHPGR